MEFCAGSGANAFLSVGAAAADSREKRAAARFPPPENPSGSRSGRSPYRVRTPEKFGAERKAFKPPADGFAKIRARAGNARKRRGAEKFGLQGMLRRLLFGFLRARDALPHPVFALILGAGAGVGGSQHARQKCVAGICAGAGFGLFRSAQGVYARDRKAERNRYPVYNFCHIPKKDTFFVRHAKFLFPSATLWRPSAR